MRGSSRVELIAAAGIPMVKPGDDLVPMVCDGLALAGTAIEDGDVVVLAQKIVSKSEGRFVSLDTIVPSARASEIARVVLKDERLVELILRQSRRVVRMAPNVLIVEHQLGLIMANAGVDQSNVGSGAVLLLPEDPDASAKRLRSRFRKVCGAEVAVVINDSFGRPWRQGAVGVAIGAAGVPSLSDRRGKPDLFGRPLEVTVVGLADEIASAASLVMGQGDEGIPAVVVRGLKFGDKPRPAAAILRPAAEDLFP